jgi:threonine synthase
MYPHGKVSEVQRRQMTTPEAANVHALAIEGHFDDAQARLKDMFNDHAFRDEVRLAGVNSINWARVLAQVVYYFASAVALGAPHRAVDFVVPTGNFGDIFAGYIAKRMGLPVGRLVIATNQNDILHRTVAHGDHSLAEVRPSISPSMDIQVSSNFERLLFDLLDREPSAVRQLMEDLKARGGYLLSQGVLTRLKAEFDSDACDEDATRATIRATLKTSGELICPHTATAVHAAHAVNRDPARPAVILATAHPAKFPDAVEEATGIRPALPPRMADLYDRPERVTRVANDLGALEALIRERIA